MSPESDRQLWCAVISQAIDDAACSIGPRNRKSRNVEIRRARDWLTKPNEDFADVCRLAGYEPDRIRAQVIKCLAKTDADRSTPRDVRYTHDGKALTLAEWSTITGIGYQTLRSRIKHGWSIERAITKPVQRHRGTVASFSRVPDDRSFSVAQDSA